MILKYMLLGLNVIGLAGLISGLVYYLKQARFEKSNRRSYHLLALGLFLTVFIVLLNIIGLLAEYDLVREYIWMIGINEDYVVYISNLGLVPLVGLVFLIALFLIKKE